MPVQQTLSNGFIVLELTYYILNIKYAPINVISRYSASINMHCFNFK